MTRTRKQRRRSLRSKQSRRTQVAGASVHQPQEFFSRGGFYPTLMGGVIQNGPYLMSAAFAQGARLIQGDKKRMSRRKRASKA
jgi:hypothetical protein